MLDLYGQGHPVGIANVWTLEVIPEAYRAASAAAHIAWVVVPHMVNGALVGTPCEADMQPRVWATAEVDIVIEASERLWATIARGRAEEALRTKSRRCRS